jgi:hypothetical protein
MQPTDPTIDILKGILDEVRGLREDTNARFAETHNRLDTANLKLHETNSRLERLERRQTESETRLANDLLAVVNAVHEVGESFREDRGLREKVDDHERRLTAIEKRAEDAG